MSERDQQGCEAAAPEISTKTATKTTAKTAAKIREGSVVERVDAAFARAETEDDDGYDPWSDRPARREPLFVEDPWR